MRNGPIAVAVATGFLLLASPALGGFSSSPAPPAMTIGSATIQPPTGVGAANHECTPVLSRSVKVTWTVSPSSFADGYEIFRTIVNGGPYSSLGTVSGHGTVEYVDATVAASTTYYYVVQAKKHSWRSANSNQASVTTLTALCL